MNKPTERERFDHLLAAHSAALSRVAGAWSRNLHEREDLLQDIALALWTALPGFRGECSERSFVHRVALNRCISRASRRAPVLALSDEVASPAPDPEKAVSDSQRRQRLADAVRSLPEAHRQVVVLGLEGLSHAEISEILGISVNNVAVRMNRARAALRELLGGL